MIDELIAALACTAGEVKLIEHRAAKRVTRFIPVHHATMLVERYSHDTWQFRLRKCGCVKWLQRMATAAPAWQRCYRTAEAPVLQPSVEWLTSRMGR